MSRPLALLLLSQETLEMQIFENIRTIPTKPLYGPGRTGDANA